MLATKSLDPLGRGDNTVVNVVNENDTPTDGCADAVIVFDIADAIPDTIPNVIDDAVPDAVPDAIPDAVPDAVFDAIADIIADAVPDAVPDIIADAVSNAIPDAVPDAITNTNDEDVKASNDENIINDEIKDAAIKKCVNEYLNISCPKIIFIYTSPKVGSTSLVSSFRIFTSKKINIFHFHNEYLLPLEYKRAGVTIKDLIRYCATVLGKKVYVIDVYRTPVEKKISTYFDRLSTHHFNAPETTINTYSMERIIKRFNDVFPYLGNCDYWMDDYYGESATSKLPATFPYAQKHLSVDCNLVKYIKLRLTDSGSWGSILSSIFGCHIEVISDYMGENKALGKLYAQFKKEYKLPQEFLNDIRDNDKQFQYYMSNNERELYLRKWQTRSTDDSVSYFNKDEYDLYSRVSLENSYMDFVQTNTEHYLDQGCVCDRCMIVRNRVAASIISNPKKMPTEKIHHHATAVLTLEKNKTANENMIRLHNMRRRHRGKSRSKSRSRSASMRMNLLS